jgi:spermidine/putrescine transport system substrate-binding protein
MNGSIAYEVPQEAARHALTRRGLLQGAGLGASALLLAACSSGVAGKPEAAVDKSETQKSLRFDGRDTYRNTAGEDYPLLGKFGDATGISVTFTNAVSDDNVYYAKVKDQLKLGQDIGADMCVLSDWMAARWIRMGYVQRIDRASIANFINLRIMFQDSDFDPGRRATLPWRSGFTGIAWNKDALPEGLASVSDLWDPLLRGRVGAMSSMRDTLGLLMMDAGVDISTKDWGDAEFSSAIETLRAQVAGGQLRSIKGNKYKEDLKSGATVAAIARAGDIAQINLEAGDKWEFAIPSKGGVLWNDVVVIPVGSTHHANAERFVDFYYDRTNAAETAAATNFISPVDLRQPELKAIPQEKSRDLMIFPTEATFQTTRSFRALDQGEEQRYLAQWQTILLGASS